MEVRNAGDDAVAWLQLATAESESGTAPLFVTHWYEVARLQRQALRHAPAVQVRAALQRHAILGQNLLVLKETQRLLQVLLDPLLKFARTMRSPSETERRDPYSAMIKVAIPSISFWSSESCGNDCLASLTKLCSDSK